MQDIKYMAYDIGYRMWDIEYRIWDTGQEYRIYGRRMG